MTLEISELNALVFTVGCLVTYFVYKHTRRTQHGLRRPGDPVAAITAGTAVILALAFLIGAGEKETDDAPTPAPSSITVPDERSGTSDHPGADVSAR